MVAVGLTIAAAGFAGRYAVKAMKQMKPQVQQALQNLPKSAFSGYYRGGFEPKMTKREAALILGVSPTANRSKIREAHRRIMLLNHPDKGKMASFKAMALLVCTKIQSNPWDVLSVDSTLQKLTPKLTLAIYAEPERLLGAFQVVVKMLGGSPYVAAKINEAKDLLEDQAKK